MKRSSEKNFGILFTSVFLLIAIWPLMEGETVRIWSLVLSFIFLIVMALIFFIILTPLSFIIRIFGKDLLRLNFSKNRSYWIKREKNITTMDKQF